VTVDETWCIVTSPSPKGSRYDGDALRPHTIVPEVQNHTRSAVSKIKTTIFWDRKAVGIHASKVSSAAYCETLRKPRENIKKNRRKGPVVVFSLFHDNHAYPRRLSQEIVTPCPGTIQSRPVRCFSLSSTRFYRRNTILGRRAGEREKWLTERGFFDTVTGHVQKYNLCTFL